MNDLFDGYFPQKPEGTDEEIENWLQNRQAENPIYKKLSLSDVKKNVFEKKYYEKYSLLSRDHIHLLSLCKNKLDENMWAKYADDYNGICLGYKAIDLYNSNTFWLETPVKDSRIFQTYREIIVNSIPHYFYELEKVQYDNRGQYIFNMFNPNYDVIKFNLLHKKRSWKMEQKFRAIFVDKEKDSSLIDVKVPYFDNTFAEIIFGFRVPQDKINNILELVKKHYSNYSEIKMSVVLPNYEKYKLETVSL